LNKINILIAYPYFSKAVIKKLREMERCEYRLIVDSGAFTAWNTGKKIELDDYCKFLDSISEFAPYRAVQLDVLGDPEKSWVNYKIMKERGQDQGARTSALSGCFLEDISCRNELLGAIGSI